VNKQQFDRLLRDAEINKQGDPDYWGGYIRGLRRAYHGAAFSTDAEHEKWAKHPGYMAGLAALKPESVELPTAAAVHAFLRRHEITGAQAARMLYLSGSRQVRKYTGGENPRQMDGARWFCLHAHVLLSPEQIAEIESAMGADLIAE